MPSVPRLSFIHNSTWHSRSHLELELRRERDRWSQSHQRSQESKKGPKNWLRQDGKLKVQEENAKLKQPLRENSVLPHSSPLAAAELCHRSCIKQNLLVLAWAVGAAVGAWTRRDLPALPGGGQPEPKKGKSWA
ncbi:hypothetical protein EK904_002084 [Melospiza melodia maxima]|nr:hypothetical protein EK904_002084 [Melospiza melodia maxima]